MDTRFAISLVAAAPFLLAPSSFGQGADECANADVLAAGPGVAAFDTNMCSDTGLPATIGVQVSTCDTGSDVWFLWTASINGTATIDVCGAPFDTELTAYDGTCGALVELGCNDDSCLLASSLTIPITAGASYYIQLGSWSSTAVQEWGAGSLTITEAPPPPPNLAGGTGNNCIETLFAGGNNGSLGGAVYFDLATTEEITVYNVYTHFLAATSAGVPVGLEVYVTLGTSVGNQANPGVWTLVGVDDGSAIGTGVVGEPTNVPLAQPITVPPGMYGVALVAIGASHAYTNGTGVNQNFTDGVVTLALGSASNVPFAGAAFSPRVWNGGFCYDTPDVDTCLTTLVMANNGGNIGGAVYFDLRASNNISITSIASNFDPVNSPAGSPVGLDVYAFPVTSVGAQGSASGWILVGTDDGAATASGLLDVLSTVNLAAPINLPAGSYGIALVATNGASHDYTSIVTGIASSYSDGTVTINLGTASNVPFTAPTFSPRGWNGTLCYSTEGIGNSFCSSNANSTGGMGDLNITGSTSLATNALGLVATGLPLDENGYFVVSTSAGVFDLVAAGFGDGILCLGSGKGRMFDTAQSTGLTGTMSAGVDLTMLPRSAAPFLYSASAGQTLYFQAWHRDMAGTFGNNFSDGESVTISN